MAQIRDFREYSFQEHFRDFYADSGTTYHFYEPAYRYGYDLAYGYRYRNRCWSALEEDARRDWERRHPKISWEEVREAVQHSWEMVRGNLQMPDPINFPLRKW